MIEEGRCRLIGSGLFLRPIGAMKRSRKLIAGRAVQLTPVRKEKGDANLFLDLGGRVHPQIAWAKLRALRDGAAIASKKLWS